MGRELTGRFAVVRWRTWALTLTITTLLILYVFVTLSVKSHIDIIDFILTAAMQIATHFAYFPDGERYGETDELYIKARDDYNRHANAITSANAVSDLREFCEYDLEERKKRYIRETCGKIGITVEEFNILKQKSKKELSKIEKIEQEGNIVYFTRTRRRLLKKLVFGKCPIRPNSPDIILSAVDRDYIEPVHDESITYKRATHGIKLFRVIIVGLVLAYIGYTYRKGISVAAITKSAVFMGSMVACAVSSFISGEKSSRVYRRKFYIELSVLIEEFSSWLVETRQKKLFENI